MTPRNHIATIDCPNSRQVTWSLIGSASDVLTKSVAINSDTFRIGRRQDMDLCVDSMAVSGFHAELFRVKDFLFVRDVGSTNGTFLNGTEITRDSQLHNGDTLSLGDTSFRVLQHSNDPRMPRLEDFRAVLKTNCFKDTLDAAGQRNFARLLASGGTLASCYQSIHDLKTRDIAGYEFLARSSDVGIETAGQLFGQASKAGRSVELSVLCRQQAFAHCHLLHSDSSVFVNTHPAEPLMEVVLPQMQTLRDAYPGRGMVLEIHEAATTDPALIRRLRQELAAMNVKLAFDDFGAGQTRIREMISGSADYIKFDPSLIRDLLQASKEQRRFFTSILNGIKDEGTITVAEGVETVEMDELVRELDFDLVQGYLYSRPTIMT
jgi:EAL domain-containing protein (putative c-di-GMP-specific phosphodiesterase class I)